MAAVAKGAFHLTFATLASFYPCLTFDYNKNEMMLASVADVKWNAPLALRML